jgi:hypothetical protein
MKKIKVAIFLFLPTDLKIKNIKNFGRKMRKNFLNVLIFSNFYDFKDGNSNSNLSLHRYIFLMSFNIFILVELTIISTKKMN